MCEQRRMKRLPGRTRSARVLASYKVTLFNGTCTTSSRLRAQNGANKRKRPTFPRATDAIAMPLSDKLPKKFAETVDNGKAVFDAGKTIYNLLKPDERSDDDLGYGDLPGRKKKSDDSELAYGANHAKKPKPINLDLAYPEPKAKPGNDDMSFGGVSTSRPSTLDGSSGYKYAESDGHGTIGPTTNAGSSKSTRASSIATSR